MKSNNPIKKYLKCLMLFCIFKYIIKTNKMNNIKDIIIGIFAVIGFAAMVTGFTNETSDPQYPESHLWEMEISDGGRTYMYNKVTGEVRLVSFTLQDKDGAQKDVWYHTAIEGERVLDKKKK